MSNFDHGTPGGNYELMRRAATAQAQDLAARGIPACIYFVPKDEHNRLAVWYVRPAADPKPKNWAGESVAPLETVEG